MGRLGRRASLSCRLLTVCLGSLLAGSSLLSAPVSAREAYPTGPVRIIVGFPPGGGADLLARLLAPQLQERLGQPFVVENRAGAQGRIGTDAVAKAKPDGHTILMATEGALVIVPHLGEPLPYDPLKDLKPVSLAVRTAPVIVAHPSHQANTFAELLELAKANPGKYVYGHSGVGGPNYLAFELLNQMAGIQVRQIPYKGTGVVIPAVISNEVGLAIGYIPSFMPHIASGSVKPLAVTLAERSDALPDVPTVAESGVPGYEMSSWLGVFVPAGTSDAIVQRLYEAISVALQNPEVRGTIQKGGQQVVGSTPEVFAETVQQDYGKYKKLIESLNLK